MNEYIVKDVPYEQELQDYLNSNPVPGYKVYQILSFTSGQFGFQKYQVVWERVTENNPGGADS